MDIQVLATTSDSGLEINAAPVSGIAAPKESGYSPCTVVGDLIFIAGQLARNENGQIAAEARVPAGQLWKGTRIWLETTYLIQRRLRPILSLCLRARTLPRTKGQSGAHLRSSLGPSVHRLDNRHSQWPDM